MSTPTTESTSQHTTHTIAPCPNLFNQCTKTKPPTLTTTFHGPPTLNHKQHTDHQLGPPTKSQAQLLTSGQGQGDTKQAEHKLQSHCATEPAEPYQTQTELTIETNDAADVT